MKFDSLEELEKAASEKKYASIMAEYKRTAKKSHADTILRPIDDLWNIMYKKIFKDTEESSVYVGQKIKVDDGTAFIKAFSHHKIISIIFFNSGQFITQTYEFKSLPNTFTKLTFTQLSKRDGTITGLNGQLGMMMYKWQIKKRAIEVFKSLQPKKDKEK